MSETTRIMIFSGAYRACWVSAPIDFLPFFEAEKLFWIASTLTSLSSTLSSWMFCTIRFFLVRDVSRHLHWEEQNWLDRHKRNKNTLIITGFPASQILPQVPLIKRKTESTASRADGSKKKFTAGGKRRRRKKKGKVGWEKQPTRQRHYILSPVFPPRQRHSCLGPLSQNEVAHVLRHI